MAGQLYRLTLRGRHNLLAMTDPGAQKKTYCVWYRNILVCDNTEEAKQLSWGQGGERHKVATLEGTLFAKAGTITGGMAGNLLGRSQRWGDKEYETLKKVHCMLPS